VCAIAEPERSVTQLAAQAPLSTSVNTSGKSGTAPAVCLKTFDRTELEPVKEQLAAYIGPMARVIVDRAAKRSASWRELYDTLAAEVPEGEERKKFLSRRPR
jgi:eukaryotic-like serine/threonine-protein kinase